MISTLALIMGAAVRTTVTMARVRLTRKEKLKSIAKETD